VWWGTEDRWVEEAIYRTGEPGECLGSSLSSPGDFDGDGKVDLVIGAARCASVTYRPGPSSVFVETDDESHEIDTGESTWGYPLAQ